MKEDMERSTPSGDAPLSGAVFNKPPNSAVVHAAVVMQLASLRQGTASTKGRGEVSGSGRKPWKQKHTGRARAGSNRSPVWRHGGIVFGPRPRKYNTDMPRTAYRIAIQSALSSKQAAGEVVVLSGFQLPEPKTRYVAKKLVELELPGTILLVVGSDDQALGRAARNIRGVTVMDASSLNVYDILRHDTLLVVESQVSKIQELWS